MTSATDDRDDSTSGEPALSDLLGLLRDGTISPEEMARLDRLITTDPAARRYYLRYIELCSTLRYYQGGTGRETLAEPQTGKADRSRSRLPWWVAAVAIAFGLFGLAVGVWGLLRTNAVPPGAETVVASLDPGSQPAQVDGVAVITRSAGAEWGTADHPTVGAPLPKGRVRLLSGLVQLEFYTGGSVILEGPADFELQGPDRGFCREGKIKGRFPARDQGFTITTPGLAIDQGTNLGVRVDATGGTEVHVFDGKVRLSGSPMFTPREVVGGHGIRVSPGDEPQSILAQENAFTGEQELERLAAAEAKVRFAAWQASSNKLRTDPRVAVYYPFEPEYAWDRNLRNAAPGHAENLNGMIVGAEWTDGRWPGKRALDFKRVGDRVRVNVPEQFRSFTLAAWVRVDSYDRWFSALLLADGWDRGSLHWQLNDRGAIVLGAAGRQIRHNSPPVVGLEKIGQWTHLVAVCDQDVRRVMHYVDGRPVSTGLTLSDAPVRIDSAEIGNWGAPTRQDKNPVRSFNGRMDEFTIFRTALTRAEVRELYETGKPNK